MTRIKVMQVIDSLDAGGAERVAVNLANLIPRERFVSCLCTTRRDGLLSGLVGADVERITLGRRTRFDLEPLRRLSDFIAGEGIQVLHAHSSALFVALAVSSVPPFPKVIWHVHHPYHVRERSPWLYRLAAKRTVAVIAVSQALADWVQRRVWVSSDRVLYMPNFVLPPDRTAGSGEALPGKDGCRIACVANLRPQKDHVTLLSAFRRLVAAAPDAHLLLIGTGSDAAYRETLERQIARDQLDHHVSLLGERSDVAAILKRCDIAVLSSAYEGFPLALVEYGQAGLPVVATRVGQCPDVLDHGRAGLLVNPADADELCGALLSLWHSPAQRRLLGQKLRRRVCERYSSEPILRQLCDVYERFASRR